MATSALPRAIFERIRFDMLNIGILYSGLWGKGTFVHTRGHVTELIE